MAMVVTNNHYLHLCQCFKFYWNTVGKIEHTFFQNVVLEKNGPCNTNSPRLLVDYWEIKLLWQNYGIFHIKFIYTKHVNQTNEVKALSLLWWISSRRSIDIGMKETLLLPYNLTVIILEGLNFVSIFFCLL